MKPVFESGTGLDLWTDAYLGLTLLPFILLHTEYFQQYNLLYVEYFYYFILYMNIHKERRGFESDIYLYIIFPFFLLG